MDIAELLRQNRIERGYSQTALAKIVGVTQPHINELEHGRGKPSFALLERLCDALDLEITIQPKQK